MIVRGRRISNLRDDELSRLGFFLLAIGFSNFHFFRRLVGGHWEKWFVEGVSGPVWHPLYRCTRTLPDTWENRPTVLCRGTPTCEDHP